MKNVLLAILVTLTLVGTLCAGSPADVTGSAAKPLSAHQSSLSTAAVFIDPHSTNVPAMTPGDGAPMPVCAPKHNCNNDEARKVLAS